MEELTQTVPCLFGKYLAYILGVGGEGHIVRKLQPNPTLCPGQSHLSLGQPKPPHTPSYETFCHTANVFDPQF